MASDCPLCRLFGHMAPSDWNMTDTSQTTNCHVRAFSSRCVFGESSTFPDIDVILLGVVRAENPIDTGVPSFMRLMISISATGLLYATQDSQKGSYVGAHILSIDSFDYSFAKRCLSYCQNNHKRKCVRGNDQSMQFFRVIDCSTRSVIEAPSGCSYFALSYVWYVLSSTVSGAFSSSREVLQTANLSDRGKGKTEEQIKLLDITRDWNPCLENLPKVINDSIEVTLNMGLRYL